MNIAFLGLGGMGTPMAGHLLAAGHALTVWNRTPQRAQPLVNAGAALAATPAEAVRHADAVLTMLFDDAAYEDALLAPNAPVLDSLRPHTLHIACSTISVALSRRLAAEHARRSQLYVAAPVFGRPNVAAQARLWIAAAGPDEAIAAARPLLEPLSRGISVVGAEPSQAHALKLGGNFLISTMIQSLAESFVYAQSQGIEPQVFLDSVNSALFQSPFYAGYGHVMLHPPKAPGATTDLGAKDTRLLREAAAASHIKLSLADNLAEIFAQARSAGLAEEDWAVGQYKMAQLRSKQ
jgi:3-hydroxyisobutyrate dehydrogenase-like beta-hydroxyacid dehydrogenase